MPYRFIVRVEPVAADMSLELVAFIRQAAWIEASRATLAYRAHGSDQLFVHLRTPSPNVEPLMHEIIRRYPELNLQLLNDEGRMLGLSSDHVR